MKFSVTAALVVFTILQLFAQKGIIRGNVLDRVSGQPVEFATVVIEGTSMGDLTDADGFFTITGLNDGDYRLLVTFMGYDTSYSNVRIVNGSIEFRRLVIGEQSQVLKEAVVSAQRDAARSEVRISKITVTPKQIRALPSTGGESDVVQYLSVLPGVISTGDQGGQLYIRGGSPVMNKVLLDGMTIYNPFHSIGFFSVFETETIRNVDVLTGGFNAEYGNRVGAVVDIKTREGNRKRLAGMVSASPFMAKAILEGPIVPLKDDNSGSVSFLLSGKYSYLDRTDDIFYKYANRTTNTGTTGLPFSFLDGYGKVSFMTGNGSRMNLFGFNFTDRFFQPGISELRWASQAGGSNFTIIPPGSSFIIGGMITYSRYRVDLNEFDREKGAPSEEPRSSEIGGFNAVVDFTSYGDKSELKYGFELNGFNTDFSYINPLGVRFRIEDNTSELAGFFKYKKKADRLIVEPGLRVQYYVSLGQVSVEPRLGFKVIATDRVRIKGAAGLYSQNLISTVNEDDIVNLFVGFLASPERIFELGSTTKTSPNRLQKSQHAVVGFEVDLTDRTELNIEPYLKRFPQIISINRLKLNGSDPDFMVETGTARGIDVSLKYDGDEKWYLWGTYSLGFVDRFDGQQTYFTTFDRRHNMNLLVTRYLNEAKNFEASLRFNYGSGFAFTQTQGFYDFFDFGAGSNTDILTGNGDIGVILSATRNGGRLSDYHRLDASIKRTLKLGKYTRLEALAAVTNVYNRRNIFYVNRKEQQKRVYQLPVLPSASLAFFF